MPSQLPLSALLSQLLVAFTIEFDNEAERQMQHRTTRHGSTGEFRAPWLVSMVMWFNCMQFVGEEGIPVRELETRATMKTNLHGMQRWGYVTVAPGPEDSRPRPPRSAWVIRATPAGKKAQEVWRNLFPAIEKCWEERFGESQIRELRECLSALIDQFSFPLPDCLPILGYGLTCGMFVPGKIPATNRPVANQPLPSLMAKVLLAFALEYERESEVSLAIGANLLRLIKDESVRIRDLPRLAGVSKEAIAFAYKFLERHGYALVKTVAKVKHIVLTANGSHARDEYFELVNQIESRWQEKFGQERIANLRRKLEGLVGDPSATASPLFLGLEPHASNWRASVPKPEVLPYFPMVLHRGGYPDGS